MYILACTHITLFVALLFGISFVFSTFHFLLTRGLHVVEHVLVLLGLDLGGSSGRLVTLQWLSTWRWLIVSLRNRSRPICTTMTLIVVLSIHFN